MTAVVGHDLRFCVLGPLEVFRVDAAGGARVPVPVPGGRQRAVLVCLLVHGGRPVAPDVLVEAAWGAGLPADPRAALHTVVSRLRSTLGEEAVASGPVGYRLRLADGALDSERAEQLRAAARTAPPGRAAELLAEALDLFRGPAYAEHADLDFARAEAARLDRLRLDVVEEHAAAALAAGDPEGAAAELYALLADNPYREHAVELLMTALYRAGRHVEALDVYRDHRRHLSEELGLEPPPGLRDLEARILGHDLPPAREGQDRPAGAWMDVSTSFVGRDGQTAELLAAARDCRLVTVSGPGGVGKSRLVAEALDRLVERVGTPAAVVELGAVAPGGVILAVADALGRRDAPDAGALAEYLGLAHRLLVLDGCEHVLDEVASLATVLQRACPRLCVVATSRRRLGVPGEHVVVLDPLPVPGEAGAGPGPAVELYLDRVGRLRAGAVPDEHETAAVGRTCRVLDGLPLAIELAASRAATLGAGAVLDSLVGADGAGPTPVVDLEEVVDWSARLLDDEERRLLYRLAVFVDRFDLEAATALEALAADDPPDPGRTAAAVAELVESHLLAVDGRAGAPAYRMLTLVRTTAEQLLERSGEADRVRLAHARWAAALAAGAAEDWLGGDAPAAAGRLARSAPDLVAAVRWALDQDRVALAAQITGPVQLCLHWVAGPELADLTVEVGRRCADRADPALGLGAAAGAMVLAVRGEATDRVRDLAGPAREPAADPRARFLAALALSVSMLYAGDHVGCVAWTRRAQEPDVPAGYAAEGPVTEALAHRFAGDLVAAGEAVRVGLAASQAAGARAAHAFARYAAGELESGSDPDRGAELFRAAVAGAEEIGAAQVSDVARLALFAVLVRQGRRDEALDLVRPLLDDLLRAGSWPQVWTALRITAELLVDADRPEDAALVLAAVDAAPGAPPLVGEDPGRYAALRATLQRRLGDDVLARIDRFAPGLRRTQVVDRAVTLIAELAEPAAG